MPLAPTHPKTLEENVSTFRRVCGQWATGVAIATSYYQGTQYFAEESGHHGRVSDAEPQLRH